MVPWQTPDVGINEWMPRRNPKPFGVKPMESRCVLGLAPNHHNDQYRNRRPRNFGLDRPELYLDIVLSTEDSSQIMASRPV